jgi:ubiquinol-cytochrome c reductase cytochrome b subunit
MFSALLIILILPIVDLGKSRGLQFRPVGKLFFYIFVVNFVILMQLGAKHVEFPFIELGQISTIIYFSYFLVIIPFFAYFENTLTGIREYFQNKVATKNVRITSTLNSSISIYTER